MPLLEITQSRQISVLLFAIKVAAIRIIRSGGRSAHGSGSGGGRARKSLDECFALLSSGDNWPMCVTITEFQ
jgi:hypothetical protein